MPSKFCFKEFKTEALKSQSPKIFNIANGKEFLGLICYHDQWRWANRSYPVASYRCEEGNKDCYLDVQHYTGYGNVVNKAYSYFIEGLSGDTLIITSQKIYKIGDVEVDEGVKHLFIKMINGGRQ